MKKSRIMMIVGALLLLGLFAFPMWKIMLKAPQYPQPIGMHIWVNKFKDAEPNNIKNINILNHYVGMKPIPEQIPEFEVFPIAIGIMSFLGVLIGLLGWRRLYLAWFIIMVILGSIGMYDFYNWEYEYGHNLKENAPIQFTDESGEPMAYQPPLIGNKRILNFDATSVPMAGSYLMFAGMFLTLVAYFVARKEEEKNYEPIDLKRDKLDPSLQL